VKQITLRTKSRVEMINITDEVRRAAAESGVKDGICYVFVPHTTAAITMNENADPDVVRDIETHMSRVVPESGDYRHSEGNSDGHIKSSLFGCSETVFIEDGKLVLGTWQGIFLCEFDGPRIRKVYIKIK
jgi:secondary thiamine-phosphate synthase enzyme